MGLFQKPKTSLDYLKEISAAQKKQANAAKQQVAAEKYAADRQASAIVSAEKERTNRALKLAEQQERQDLVRTLRNLSFATNDENEIEQNMEYLVPMIDGWMQSFKSARKEDFICKLAEAKFNTGLRRLQVLNSSHPMLSYYEEKQKKFEAKRKKYKWLFWVRLLVTIIVAIIVMQVFAGIFLMSGEDPTISILGVLPGFMAGFFAYRMLIGSRGTEEKKGSKDLS